MRKFLIGTGIISSLPVIAVIVAAAVYTYRLYVIGPFHGPYRTAFDRLNIRNGHHFDHSTGYFISGHGLMLTARHAAPACRKIYGMDSAGEIHGFHIVFLDKDRDVAAAQTDKPATTHWILRTATGTQMLVKTSEAMGYSYLGGLKHKPFWQWGMESFLKSPVDNTIYYIDKEIISGEFPTKYTPALHGMSGSPLIANGIYADGILTGGYADAHKIRRSLFAASKDFINDDTQHIISRAMSDSDPALAHNPPSAIVNIWCPSKS